jgi:hypothetical protein
LYLCGNDAGVVSGEKVGLIGRDVGCDRSVASFLEGTGEPAPAYRGLCRAVYQNEI